MANHSSEAARVAVLSRTDRDPAKLAEARRTLAEAQIERAIRRALAVAPPLTDIQRARLAELLGGAAPQ